MIADAGPLVALFDRRDRYHRQAVKFISKCRSRLIVNLPVLTEATCLLDFSAEARRNLLPWAARAVIIDERTAEDLPRIANLIMKNRDRPADFADASLIALAERLDLAEIATVDSDFSIYRTLSKRSLTNVLPSAG